VLLLCSGRSPPGVLHPAVEPSAQARHGPVGVGPEEGHKNDQGARTPLLRIKTERVGVFQPGEEKAVGRPYFSLSVLRGDLDGDELFSSTYCYKTSCNAFRLKEGRFRLDIRKTFFTMKLERHWKSFPERW